MTIRSLAKLIVFALIGFAGVLAAGAVGLRAAVKDQDVHAAVLAVLGKDGPPAFAVGSLRVAAWPRPAAVLEDVAFGGTGPVTVTAPDRHRHAAACCRCCSAASRSAASCWSAR